MFENRTYLNLVTLCRLKVYGGIIISYSQQNLQYSLKYVLNKHYGQKSYFNLHNRCLDFQQ